MSINYILSGWLVMTAGLGLGQVDMESLIEQALDQVVDFEVTDQPLPEAFEAIAGETGVAMTIAPGALGLLPYGGDTTMTARMHGVRLREGIDKLLQPLGMRYRVVGDHVEVVPSDALKRIGRRATWSELQTLEWLSTLEWKNAGDDVEKLRGRLRFQVDDDGPEQALLAAMRRAGAGSASDVLTSGCQSLEWTWYPWGKQIAVVARTTQVHRSLQRTVTIRAEHRPLAEVLADLTSQSGVKIRFEPGALRSLPRETRRDFSLLLVGATVEQALDVIVGATGLDYHIEADGVVMYNGTVRVEGLRAPKKSAALRTEDPIVGHVVIPAGDGGAEYRFPIRESDLPPDVAALWKQRKTGFIDRLREQLGGDAAGQN